MVGMGSDSINNNQPPPQQSQAQSSSNSSYSGSGGGYVNNSGKMQGIGSEPWDPNKQKVSMSTAAFNAARTVASKVVYSSGTPEQLSMAGKSSNGGDMSHSFASNRGSNPHSNGGEWKPTPGFSSGGGVNTTASWNDGARTNKGVGGVWGAQGGNNGGQANQPSPNNVNGGSPPVSIGNTGGGNADGSYERQLIVDLCAPGGMKPVPPQEDLDRFIKIAPSLSPDLVGPNILEQVLATTP
jgi:hypothetical protein